MYVDFTTKKRFWKHVDKRGENECWEWKAYCNSLGYGQIMVTHPKSRCAQYVHRVSWIIHNKEIPLGMCVLHKCDNPSCVNPDHLFLGTRADNNHDMINKGRAPDRKGERAPNRKLTSMEVKEIRRLYIDGIKRKLIARQFNIVEKYVYNIAARHVWKDI